MQFEAFDRETMTDYEQRAKAQWGTTKEYQIYEAKAAARTAEETAQIAAGFMEHFAAFGRLRNEDVRSQAVLAPVTALQDDISERFYPCSNDILLGLGQMYVSDGTFRRNIDAKGGDGTADFVSRAILEFCKQ